MQMKDVIISVTGIRQSLDGPDALELVTAGKYGMNADEIRLTWEESELTGMDGTHTRLTVQPRSVRLEREGTLNTSMEFEEGQKHYFLYDTPLGSATMGLDTQRIRSRLGRHGGDLLIDYVVDMDQTVVGRNRFYIQVREPQESHSSDIRWPN